jgi:TatD DNase family protein
MKIADSHCHLTMEAFDADRTDAIARAAQEGVGLFVTVPSRKGDGPACSALAAADPRIYSTAGLHPHEARLWDDDARRELADALASPRTLAIGEIGLDFHYDLSPRPQQDTAFREQIAIAREAKKPVVIHTRQARQETIDILKTEGARDTGGIIHCYTEDRATAEAILDLGFYISFSGIATFPKALDIQEAAKYVPADRILVETDAPFLAPIPHRGRRNEPALITSTLAFLARLRGETVETLAARTYENTVRAFRIPGLA